MKLAVVGSRCHIDLSITYNEIEKYQKTSKNDIYEIISGGAKGVDSAAKNYALENNILLSEHLPPTEKMSYEKYRIALLDRNTLIAKNCDQMLAIVCGCARGTWDSIRKAKNLKKNVHVVHVKCLTDLAKFEKEKN